MNTKPADEMTDDDLAEAVETLVAFARKYLPEGYVLRLECSQHADGIQLIWFEEPDGPGESVDIAGTLSAYTRREGWGFACDAAHVDYLKRVWEAQDREYEAGRIDREGL
jgi:hypothetical protein